VTAQELKDIMHNYRLSAEDVATICHVSLNAVYSWRIGRRVISRPAVALLKAHLGAGYANH